MNFYLVKFSTNFCGADRDCLTKSKLSADELQSELEYEWVNDARCAYFDDETDEEIGAYVIVEQLTEEEYINFRDNEDYEEDLFLGGCENV